MGSHQLVQIWIPISRPFIRARRRAKSISGPEMNARRDLLSDEPGTYLPCGVVNPLNLE